MSIRLTKDALAYLTLKKLLIRIIQTLTTAAIYKGPFLQTTNAIHLAIKIIRQNLQGNFSIKQLSDKARRRTTSLY